MKSRLILLPMILATTAALADPLDGSSPRSQPTDAHAQAAALLSHPPTLATSSADGAGRSASVTTSVATESTDSQAQAAALLSRPQTTVTSERKVGSVSFRAASMDAQAQAAALLSRGLTT
jgi:hypothetical protein